LCTLKEQEELTEEEKDFLKKAETVQEFLSITASQMTEEGLFRLHSEIPEGTLCVLFRNNHFSTLYKYQDSVYLLATDLGFRNTDQIVWEKLSEIHGNNKYYNSFFVNTMSSNPESPQKLVSPEEESAINQFVDSYQEDAVKRQEDDDASYALALSMQQAEEIEAERQRQELQKQQQLQRPQKPQKPQKNPKPEQSPVYYQPQGHFGPANLEPPKKKKKCIIW